MLTVDGTMDIPALEWCSVSEAVLWIEFQQAPVDLEYEAALADRILHSYGRNDDGIDVWDPRNYVNSLNALYILACKGGVTLQGKPAIDLPRIVYSSFGELFLFGEWGKLDDIPLDKVSGAGFLGFMDIGRSGFLTDRMTFPTQGFPQLTWAYSETKVNFKQLVKWSRPAEMQELRIGGDVILIDPASQHGISAKSIPRSKTDASGSPTYTTKLLLVFDELRRRISINPANHRWKYKATITEEIVSIASELGHELSQHESRAVRYCFRDIDISSHFSSTSESSPTPTEGASQIPTYTTKLLPLIDAYRTRLANDPHPEYWTRYSLEKGAPGLAAKLKIALSKNEIGALGYLLLPDEKRMGSKKRMTLKN